MDVIGQFQRWVEEVLLVKHEVTGNMTLCPYAAGAIKQEKVEIQTFAYHPEDLDPIIEKVAWLQDRPQLDVLILVHPDSPCDAKQHRRLEDRIRPLASRLGQHTFGYHPDDPTVIGGQAFKMPVCALQFQPERMVKKARKKMLKTKYYDRFSVAELKDLGFFD